jgi:arylsulfatase
LVACGNPEVPPVRHPPAFEATPTRGYILISFDTLRADHLHAYGYRRETSPVFDRLASRGVLFEQAIVQYPSTLTSHMSIFTGVYPQQHQVLPPSTVLSEEIETLPQRFQAHGFRTAGHTEGGFVAGGYGFRRGFDEFSDTSYRDDKDIERTFDRGLRFLRSLNEGERFFLFLHTYSVHDPYEPPERYRSLFWSGPPPTALSSSGENLRRANRGELEIDDETVRYFEAMYDASIRYADEVLGEFVAELERLGLRSETTLILTSDHGEEFREHGSLAHTQVYPECLRVPLLVLHPRQPVGSRISRLVETVDIAPTLYELAGLPAASQVAGGSLVRYLEGGAPPEEGSEAYAEALDAEFVRTLLAQDHAQRFQLLMVEPEQDPEGPWIRGRVTFDTAARRLAFEAQSFHTERRLQVRVDGRPHERLDLTPGWRTVEIELPPGGPIWRVTLEADGCISPAAVGAGEDDRCLAFQLRGFSPRRFELYDLQADPGAQIDLFRQHSKLRERLGRRLLSMQWTPLAQAAERPLSEADEAALRVLGYLE